MPASWCINEGETNKQKIPWGSGKRKVTKEKDNSDCSAKKAIILGGR